MISKQLITQPSMLLSIMSLFDLNSRITPSPNPLRHRAWCSDFTLNESMFKGRQRNLLTHKINMYIH